MLATLAAAWRTAMKRLRSDLLIVGAVFITVLLAAGLLAAGPIYADAVTISALQRSIADAPVSDSGATVALKVFPEDYSAADGVARESIVGALAATGGDIFAHIEADSYGLAAQADSTVTGLAAFRYFEDMESHATLTAGSWPVQTASPYETAISAATASALDLMIGDTVEVVSRLDPSIDAMVRVVGIYEVDDPDEAFWFEDPLIGPGLSDSGSFRSYGPFVLPIETMVEEFTPVRVNAEWRAFPAYGELSVSEVGALRSEIAALQVSLDLALRQELGDRVSATSGFTVATGLVERLSEVDRSLTVTRASVLALLLQLTILAGYALVLTSRLLVDTRRTETMLMRSRGTSPRQVAFIALLEGIAVTAPAALVAPFMASWLLTILNEVGPLAAIGLTIDPITTTGSIFLAAIAAALAVAVMVWPAYRSAVGFGSESRRQRRQNRQPVSQRIGLDLALIGLTALAFWQLGIVGPGVSARVRGQFGVDPLLVVAPTLGLLAGAVLALRVIPLLARFGEWLASSGRSTVSALTAWQVARRPSRYTRSSLLLIMAVGIGFLAASFSTTWIQSQGDQAAFQTGADIVAQPAKGPGSIDSMHLRGAQRSLAGVDASMPVHTILGQLAGGGGLGQFVALDAADAPEVVTIRPDLSPDFSDLMKALEDGRPTMAGVGLPGEPDLLILTFDAVEEIAVGEDFMACDFSEAELDLDLDEQLDDICFDARVIAVVQDDEGMLHRVDAGPIAVNEGGKDLVADLNQQMSDGGVLEPEYPLKLISIEIETRLPEVSSREVTLRLDRIAVGTDGSIDVAEASLDPAAWESSVEVVGSSQRRPRITGSEDGLTWQIETGSDVTGNRALFGLRPPGTVLPETIPVVVSSTFAETNVTEVGETLRLPALQIRNDEATVVGTVIAFPTTRPDLGEVILLDLPTYQMMGYGIGSRIPEPQSYWLAVSGDTAAVTVDLAAPPFNSFALAGRAEVTELLVADPVALSTIGALAVGFVAAAVFATVGFSVSAAVSARERLVEFALLRALGLSRRQLASWLGFEQGVLVVLSLALGTIVGVVLTAVVLPLITLTQSGRPPVPDVIIEYPWAAIIGLELGVVAVLALVVTVMTILLRRIGLGSLLRMGED